MRANVNVRIPWLATDLIYAIPEHWAGQNRLTCLDEFSAICHFSSSFIVLTVIVALPGKVPSFCIHGHTRTHWLYTRASGNQQGKLPASTWPGEKGFLPHLEERAWQMDKAEGFFWQSGNGTVHKNRRRYSTFFIDFIEWMVRKINLRFRNRFISMEKLSELAVISLESGLSI